MRVKKFCTLHAYVESSEGYDGEVMSLDIQEQDIRKLLRLCSGIREPDPGVARRWDQPYGLVVARPGGVRSQDFLFSDAMFVFQWGVTLELWCRSNPLATLSLEISKQTLQEMLEDQSTWLWGSQTVEEYAREWDAWTGQEDMEDQIPEGLLPSFRQHVQKRCPGLPKARAEAIQVVH